MNQLTRKTLSTAAILTALLGFQGAAHAQDSLTQRVVTGVGHVIAAQGNAALVQIRAELGETIEQALKPLLPTPDANVTAEASDAPVNGQTL
ncbi:MAG: hypothetical protein M3O62_09255 [Pseudomonadota bacterium]|nr:hypothetical protein [Pseudomonadota bacterium]